MAKTKVLIAVKTYPNLSKKYSELVCTAGFREDGSWIRIYPVPFRFLKGPERYKKWQWVEFDLEKNTSDKRKESYRLIDWTRDIVSGEFVDTKGNWYKRKAFALRNVYTNMDNLIADNKNPDKHVSLAVLKPKEIIDFICKKVDDEWDEEKVKKIYADLSQGNLFETPEEIEARKNFRLVDKLPYEFSYVFTTDDGKTRTLMIEDWEIGQLYRNLLKQYKDENIACLKVKQKYLEEFAKTKDLYLFMGTTARYDGWATNPFVIIGTFTPNIEAPSLFDDFD